MISVEYDFYIEEYGGTKITDETAFKQPLLKANTYLDSVMHVDPDESNLELVKLCLCEAAELIYEDKKTGKSMAGGRYSLKVQMGIL